MDYYKFQITARRAIAEILTAMLASQPFDTFQDTDDGVDAYLPAHEMTPAVEDYLGQLKKVYDFEFQKEFIPGQNWNEIWETHFHPVVVGGFCGIRADFHPPIEKVKIELVINPKMAFGTGHHETTHMVVEIMEALPFDGAVVLDYGCGTGLLAILASKLGAAHIDAVDIEEESYRNTLENSRVNQVENIAAYHGTLEAVPGNGYDIILANINRNVILASLPSLSRMLKPGGILVVSGFVLADEDLMKNAFPPHHFHLTETKRNNNWLAMVLEKR